MSYNLNYPINQMALAKIFEIFVILKESEDWPQDAVPDFFSGGLQAAFGGDTHV